MKKPDYVVDSYALMAYLGGEAGAEQVKAHHAVSYADAFAIALAQEKEAPVITGDPEFEKVEYLVKVIWL